MTTPNKTPTLISGVLSCDTVAPGVTCANYGAYLDYNINIVVTGLTGGATAYDNFIGTYKRTTNGGEMGMTSDFTHCETSGYIYNTVSSAVHIQPFDAAGILYPVFASSTGTDVCVTNNVVNDWRSIGGTGGWSNGLSVKGNVDWPITGYSIVGHIYLYSNQNFMTVTPTSTPTATSTPTITPTSAAQCYGDSCNGYYAESKGCNINAKNHDFRNLHNTENTKIGEIRFRYSEACYAQWAQIVALPGYSFYAEDSIRWGYIDYTSDMWAIAGQIFNANDTLYTYMYGVNGGVFFPPALVCGAASVATPLTPPALTPAIVLSSPYGTNNCIAR